MCSFEFGRGYAPQTNQDSAAPKGGVSTIREILMKTSYLAAGMAVAVLSACQSAATQKAEFEAVQNACRNHYRNEAAGLAKDGKIKACIESRLNRQTR